MSIFIKADANPTAPLVSNPFVEKDYAIVRGVTQGMMDWSNPDTYVGTGAITGGAVFNNLVNGGAAGALSLNSTAALAGLSGGLLRADAGTPQSGSTTNFPNAQLGVSFRLDTAARDALFVFWMAAPISGWEAVAGTVGIASAGTGAGALTQWALYATKNASGVITSLTARMYGTSATIDLNVAAGATLNSIFDGTVHQIGLRLKIDTSTGLGQATLYRDGILVATGATGAMTQFNQPGGGVYNVVILAAVGTGSMVNGFTPAGSRIGRAAMHNLTTRPDVTVAGLLARDIKAAGYIT